MKLKHLFLTVVAVFTIASCGENSNKKNEQSSFNNNEIETNGEVEINNNEADKINILINIFNSFSSETYKAYDSYVKEYGEDPEKFMKYKDRYRGHNIHTNTINDLKELNKATDIDILNELDPLILKYQSTALALAKHLNESESYYDMKDYEADNYKKAKKLHKPTLTAFNNFFEIDDILRKKSNDIQSELELAYLKELKDMGNILGYLTGMSINKSEKVLYASQKDTYENLDIKSLEKTHSELRDVFDELTEFKNDKPEEFDKNVFMSSFYGDLKSFVKASKDLSNRKKENRPFSTGEKMNLNQTSGWMVNGSTYKVLHEYNELISSYNSMIQFD